MTMNEMIFYSLVLFLLVATFTFLICYVMSIIWIFHNKGAMHGIFSILICIIYAFIMELIEAKKNRSYRFVLIWFFSAISVVASRVLISAVLNT